MICLSRGDVMGENIVDTLLGIDTGIVIGLMITVIVLIVIIRRDD